VPGASLPPSYADHWDAAHVKLPCSPRNVAKGGVAGGRWPVIVQTLSSPLPTYDALEQALVAGQSPPHRARPTTPRGQHSALSDHADTPWQRLAHAHVGWGREARSVESGGDGGAVLSIHQRLPAVSTPTAPQSKSVWCWGVSLTCRAGPVRARALQFGPAGVARTSLCYAWRCRK
jgi:hypothetical protein